MSIKELVRVFHFFKDYAILKKSLGNLSPKLLDLYHYCEENPDFTWVNRPINPILFPKHPLAQRILYRDDIYYRLYNLLYESEMLKRESIFLMTGPLFRDHVEYQSFAANISGYRSARYNEENANLVNFYAAQPNVAMMIGHSHPNYNPSYIFFSLGDILAGISDSIQIRKHTPQMPHKVIFSLAYLGTNGLTIFPLIYDPSIQKPGGSAIFRLC